MLQRIKSLLLQNRGVKQTVVKNFFWLSFAQIVTRIFRAIILIYAARAMGADGYGVFSYALGLAGFFTAFADIGVTQIVTREAAKKPEKRSEYFATAFWMKSILLLIAGAAIWLLAPHFSNVAAADILLPFVALLTISDGIQNYTVSYFRSEEKMQTEAAVVSTTNLSIMVLGFIALSFSSAPQIFMYAYVGSSVVGTLLAVYILRHEFRHIIANTRKFLMKPIIQAALPIAFSSLFGVFMLNADYVVLGWIRTATEIGYYAAAQKIVQLLYVLPSIMATGIFPTISRLVHAGDHARVRSVTEKTMLAMLAVAVPITIGGIVLSAPLIDLIYGQAYAPATLALQILMATLIFVFIGNVLGNLLFAYDKQKETAIYVSIAAVLNVVLDLLLAPRFGIYGVSAGTLAVQFVYITSMLKLTKKTNPIKIFPYLKKITAAAIVMGVLSWGLNAWHVNVILNVILSAGVYVGLLYAFKENLVQDIKGLIRAV